MDNSSKAESMILRKLLKEWDVFRFPMERKVFWV